MILINEGISQKLLDAVVTGAQNSDAFSLPTKATQLTWQTSFGVAPASITVQLQTSLDNLTWSTIDTSTSVAGEDRTIATSALFIRARINAISGGSAITVQLVCKTGFIGLTTPSLVTDGSLVLFDGTTGSKLKELLFPGGTTTFLRADGTFAAAGGGGGTPASPVNSVQYNNAGSFGGNATITIEGTPSALVVANVGSAFGSLAIANNDQSFPYFDSATGLAVLQNTGAVGFNYNSFLVDTIVDNDASNIQSGEVLAEIKTARTKAVDVLTISSLVDSLFSTSGQITGIHEIQYLRGNFAGVSGLNLTFTQVDGISTDVSGIVGASTQISGSGAATRFTGFYFSAPALTTLPLALGFYAQALGGSATNAYSFWSDEQGVYRIHADNTFNSVYQAITALYNPQFAKYTPGATDFERIVQQWESNVAVIRTEKGGSGTLRDINIAGAHFRVNNNIGIAASVTTAALVGKTMTFVDGILTGFA